MQQPLPDLAALEQPVATLFMLRDPRRRNATASFALWQCVNDTQTLSRLLAQAAETLMEQGIRRVLGPVGSPHICKLGCCRMPGTYRRRRIRRRTHPTCRSWQLAIFDRWLKAISIACQFLRNGRLCRTPPSPGNRCSWRS